MLKNYIMITVRNLIRNKTFSLINILGLTIGITSTILILLWVQDELSYEQFFNNSENIYRVNKSYQIGNETGYNPSTPYPLAKDLKDKFAEIEEATKFSRRRFIVRHKDKTFSERRVYLTDTSFFKIFSYKFIQGNAQTALSQPNSVVLTESLAEKYFGNLDPLGQLLTINNQDEFIISAVIEDTPLNSDIQFDLIIPISFIIRTDDEDNWGSHWLSTYILLHQKIRANDIEPKLSTLIRDHLPQENISLKLQPLDQMHLYAINGEPEGIKSVYFFTIIAFFILIIACINFMNLSTARASKRAKETGLRKVMGANKAQIVKQFLGESLFFTIVALAIAFVLIELIRPVFNELTGKQLAIDYASTNHLISIIFIVLITGLLSGSYPAVFLSSFRPLKILKGNIIQESKNKSGFRKILVLVQFTLSIIILIGTGIIYTQLNFIQNKELGFNKDNVIYFSLNSEIRKKFNLIKRELLQHPQITAVTRASELPSETWSIMRGIKWEGKDTDEGAAFAFASVDYDYFELLQMEIVHGRSFSRAFSTDSINYIFNEKAISVMNMESPIGKLFSLDDADNGTIIGVVKDFHFLPFTYEIEPMVLVMNHDFYREALIRIHPDNMENTISAIEKIWQKFIPGFPFEYHFLDDQFKHMYNNEEKFGEIFGYFVILAIFVSCLGLFGLASFTAERRTKEIGIRKVLGASIPGIIFTLSVDFTKWILMANIIAWPIAWFAMNQWLQNFAYKADIGLWIYISAGGLTLIIALLTVSTQAIKAALANPAEALRYE